MALTELFIPKVQYDPDADPLAKPLPQETEDLSVHVELCARRYGAIMRGQFELRQLLVRALALAVLALAAWDKGPDLIDAVLKVM